MLLHLVCFWICFTTFWRPTWGTSSPKTMTADPKETLSRLRSMRGGHRGTVTKLEKEVDELLNNASAFDVNRLQVIDRQLEGKLTTLDKLDTDIQNLCDLEQLTQEIEESDHVTARILECRERIRVWNIQASNVNGSSMGQNPSSQHSSSTTSSFTAAKPKLPKLTLPKFRGEITNWNTFWDSYNSAIHSNEAISDIDKFNYLKSLVEGPAARVMQGLNLTEANYNSAVELLKDRFGKPQQIISAHMDELLKIPNCVNDKPHSLRTVYDKISVHTRGLASLGVSSKEYGSLLIPVIMSKLPTEIRIQIARNSNTDVWNIEDLMKIIKTELEAREAGEAVKANDNFTRKSAPSNNAPHKVSGTPTSSTFLSNHDQRSQSNENFTIRCVYCEDPHYSASCKRVANPQKRREILQRKNRCFVCLSFGHRGHECRSTKTCRNCKQRHHQSICGGFNTPLNTGTTVPVIEERTPDSSEVITSTTSGRNERVLLQIARAFATNEDGTKSTPVRVLFDNGSQRSYVTNNLKSNLNLKPYKTETLHLNTFGDQRYRKQSCEVVKLRLHKSGHEEIEITALSFPVICSSVSSKIDIRKFPHLECLELADDFDNGGGDSIDILIGADNYWNIVEGDTVRGESGPIAVRSKLGWLLSGPGGIPAQSNAVLSNLVIAGEHDFYVNEVDNDQLVDTLKHFWETESIGIKEKIADEESSENSFLKNLSYDGTRYVVGLPWKLDREPIPSEYQLCCNRLNGLHRKLKRDPEQLTEYDGIIKEQLQMGIIEEVKEEKSTERFSENVHYLPHHAVLRQDRETTKVRIVYDGSAKTSGKSSLNDCLQVGPNLIPQLFDVLVKFRSNPIALTADIEKAFLMISMNESSKDLLRFLWFKDPTEVHPDVVQFRFCRLVFGLRPSPSILVSTIRYHLDFCEKLNPELREVINLLRERLYVDDFLGGADSVKEAEEIYQESREIMRKGGFNLRKWNSNSKEVLQAINASSWEEKFKPAEFTQEDESYAKATTGPTTVNQESKFVKVLGVNWNTESDEFLFDFTELIKFARSLPVTKRSLLKLSAKIFDPLGLLSPFVIQMKIMFQELCTQKVNWDQELHGETLLKWNSFLTELESLNNVRIPRYYFLKQIRNPVRFKYMDLATHQNKPMQLWSI